VTVTEVRPIGASSVAPSAMLLVPSVIDEFVKLELAMFDNVLVEPLIDLLVNVWVPVSVATVESMAMVTGAEPL
jgi:hypothetical protein